MVPGNTHCGRKILFVKKQQSTCGRVIDTRVTSLKPFLKSKTILSNVMIKATKTAVFFSPECTAKRFTEARYIFKMRFQWLSFGMCFRCTVRQIVFDCESPLFEMPVISKLNCF